MKYDILDRRKGYNIETQNIYLNDNLYYHEISNVKRLYKLLLWNIETNKSVLLNESEHFFRLNSWWIHGGFLNIQYASVVFYYIEQLYRNQDSSKLARQCTMNSDTGSSSPSFLIDSVISSFSTKGRKSWMNSWL